MDIFRLVAFLWLTSKLLRATLPGDRAPEAHFGAYFYTLNPECTVVACNSSFPLPESSGLLPARPTHVLRTCYVCLLFDFYPLNLEHIAVAFSYGFPLPDSSELMPASPTSALRFSRSLFKTCSPGAHCRSRSVNPKTHFGRQALHWQLKCFVVCISHTPVKLLYCTASNRVPGSLFNAWPKLA